MPGRLHQAANRYSAVARHRMDRLAELVANGAQVTVAGRQMGLSAGETASTWRGIKKQLGAEQCR